MRYLLITEPRERTSVRVDIANDELPEEALRRWMAMYPFSNSILKRFDEESEGVSLTEWYESETNEKVEVFNEARHFEAPPMHKKRVEEMVKGAFPDAYSVLTGGGCTAWWIDMNTRFDATGMFVVEPVLHALLTYEDGDHIGDPLDAQWMAGLYDIDGGEDRRSIVENVTLAQAIETVRRWKEGL